MTALMGEYEISDHFVPYIEGQFANNRVTAQLAGTPIGNGTPFGSGVIGPLNLLVNSPFFDPTFQAALAAIDASESICVADVPGTVGPNCNPLAEDADGNLIPVNGTHPGRSGKEQRVRQRAGLWLPHDWRSADQQG